MVEIPEHLRKRAEEARRKAEAKKQGESAGAAEQASGESSGGEDAGSAGAASSRIPAHLLERSKSARQQAEGGAAAASGGGVTTAPAPPTTPGNGQPLPGSGPDGNTHRLLTVVKSGSIQDVKASPQDKVHVWPHLLAAEFVAALACTAFLLVFSTFVNAPLLELANFNQTPNPSKAPWYFLGLQELLTMFHPMVAGVTIPGLGLVALILAPYTDRNPSNKPEDRKFAISLFTLFVMFWAVLTMIGSFFRGPGFNFIFPWKDGLFFEL